MYYTHVRNVYYMYMLNHLVTHLTDKHCSVGDTPTSLTSHNYHGQLLISWSLTFKTIWNQSKDRTKGF